MEKIKELLPFMFYIMGSVCFLIGSVLSIVQRLVDKGG